MLTLQIPTDIHKVISEKATLQSTTPELYLLKDLRERYLPSNSGMEPNLEGLTMADFLKDFIGCIDSSDTYPNGSKLSENTGAKVAQLIVGKHYKG